MVQRNALRTMGLICAVALASMLGGCLSSAEIAQINAAADTDRCAGYGFKPGTEAFAKCRFDLDRRRDDERAALLEATAAGPVFVPSPGPCWHTPWGLRCDPW